MELQRRKRKTRKLRKNQDYIKKGKYAIIVKCMQIEAELVPVPVLSEFKSAELVPALSKLRSYDFFLPFFLS